MIGDHPEGRRILLKSMSGDVRNPGENRLEKIGRIIVRVAVLEKRSHPLQSQTGVHMLGRKFL